MWFKYLIDFPDSWANVMRLDLIKLRCNMYATILYTVPKIEPMLNEGINVNLL
jgi:hypothetical protein